MFPKHFVHMIKRYEDKLKEFMPEDEYAEFAKCVARESFRIECEEMTDGDFKEFVLNNFDEIVADD